MELTIFEQQLNQQLAEYHSRAGQAKHLEDRYKRLENDVVELTERTQVLEETRMLLQKAGAEARESARKRLETTVTDALRYVFGPDFKFVIELNETARRAEAEFYVESLYAGDVVKTKPEDARGGGVIDLISIALRVALIQIHSNPSIKGPIILDEPGKHVSADYTMKLSTFLKQMSSAFGRQIIVSTHQSDLASIADDTVNVEMKGGKSHVTTTYTDPTGTGPVFASPGQSD